jgi:transposase
MSRLPYAAPIHLTDDERADLKLMVCHKGIDRRHFLKASAILLSADGNSPSDVASMLSITAGMVRKWPRIFTRERLSGLFRKHRVQRPRKYSTAVTETILAIAALPPPPGKRWWTANLIASQLDGVTHSYVWNVIRKSGIDLRAGTRRTYRY